jgi:hypothetical protein
MNAKLAASFAALAVTGCLLATAADAPKAAKKEVRGAPIQKLAPATPTNAAPAIALVGTNAPALGPCLLYTSDAADDYS